MLGWDEIIADSLPQGTAVMVWRGTDKAGEAIRKGCDRGALPVPLLSRQLSGCTAHPNLSHWRLSTSPKVYAYDPLQNLTPDECKRVKGVQGNLWDRIRAHARAG